MQQILLMCAKAPYFPLNIFTLDTVLKYLVQKQQAVCSKETLTRSIDCNLQA